MSEQEMIQVEACNPFDRAAGHQRLFREVAALADQRWRELQVTSLSNPAGNASAANAPWVRARILLAGIHAIPLAGLRTVLDGARGEGLQVVGAVREHEHALAEAGRYRPDLILLGATDDFRRDLTVVRSLRRSRGAADTRIVLLRRADDAAQVSRMLKAGVSGAFPLDQDAQCVVRALAIVSAGGSIFLPAPVGEGRDAPDPLETHEPAVHDVSLTTRERDVLSLLARGLSNAEIGRELSLSVPTVKKHLTQVMRKIRQPDRLRAALYAHRQGLV
ncbi:response regulator transcription factor [Streptomyces sp. TRM76323]|uniref:Response regulator transcription factor n=1 Tax=Streptomyces tamarix TaxID=3078565 RepID=A0ABU3QV08_9ACTN|nr:response regulator transcription factor [Streptomyces tamarix]MDT9686615.1 response regulator transcription factor [Streptomyces tamarix]